MPSAAEVSRLRRRYASSPTYDPGTVSRLTVGSPWPSDAAPRTAHRAIKFCSSLLTDWISAANLAAFTELRTTVAAASDRRLGWALALALSPLAVVATFIVGTISLLS